MTHKNDNQGTRRGFSRPKGTRDFYPEDLLKRRYITETWRRVALRHGFDEIDGPTFEHLNLYTVKSGEGIVSELFSFNREGGDETYALRPEFTPSLARMYAARAKQLPVPTKWFCIPTFYRAERPQRGRLREFLQWNVDILGDNSTFCDAELIDCAAASLISFGLTKTAASIKVSNRQIVQELLPVCGIHRKDFDQALQFLDRLSKLSPEERGKQAAELGFDLGRWAVFKKLAKRSVEEKLQGTSITITNKKGPLNLDTGQLDEEKATERVVGTYEYDASKLTRLAESLKRSGSAPWVEPDFSIVRGLAYYTGTVFEVIAEGERAVAGGGRYDGLVELLGGPPTPAVGFAMGDVVLQNLLEDKGLMPEGRDLLDALDQPVPTRCEAFVIPNGSEEAEEALTPTLSALRRGEREAGSLFRYTQRPIHARRTYRATRNVGKLMKEAVAVGAKYAVILESREHATVQNLDSKDKHENVPIDEIASHIR